MAKETTYQRLKRENAELRHNLYVVCCEPDTLKARIIKTRVKFDAKLQEAMWQGDPSATKSLTGFLGLTEN